VSTPIKKKHHIVIIGGGPGGYEAALAGIQLGAEVTLIERNGVGGSAVLTDTAGRTLTYSTGATSTGGAALSINAATGAFTYTPTQTQRQAAIWSTTDTFTVTASNGVRSITQTITVIVEPAPPAPGTLNTNMKILIVNDHSGLRRVIKNQLSSLGFTNTAETDDGADAWAMVQESWFDFVVVEPFLPSMSGFDLAYQIRSSAIFNKLPILMLIGAANNANIIAATLAGIDGYLITPYTTEALGAKMVEIFLTSPRHPST
jgi:two-component system chemotaxis response regulator CheY